MELGWASLSVDIDAGRPPIAGLLATSFSRHGEERKGRVYRLGKNHRTCQKRPTLKSVLVCFKQDLSIESDVARSIQKPMHPSGERSSFTDGGVRSLATLDISIQLRACVCRTIRAPSPRGGSRRHALSTCSYDFFVRTWCMNFQVRIVNKMSRILPRLGCASRWRMYACERKSGEVQRVRLCINAHKKADNLSAPVFRRLV